MGESRAQRGQTVLVVDDEPAMRRAWERILKAAGYDVVLASDGAVAVAAIMSRSFDVILSDIQMPEMSGVELLSIVRAHDLDVPVILVTGAPTIETAIEAVALGALQYLPKPTGNDVLVAAVDRASRLHELARMKRDALRLGGAGDEAGDVAGLRMQFEHALETMWMAFQPIVDARSGRVYGYEALMRSREASLPDPGAVLGAAERLERLPELGQRTRSLSASAFAGAPDDTILFVNLHTRDLSDPSLFAHGSPLTRLAHRVVLELTERAIIDDIQQVQSCVERLREHGFRIAIDDLGAGYAGLSSFIALEPDIVKIDMSLVRNVHGSPIRHRLINSLTALCKEMSMQVVAEGVEVSEECASLRSVGCDSLQGYFFARPEASFAAAEPRW